ncbi:MAG: hypothetical protein WAJ93_09610 [Candidatus Nitrosopolaris sp.]
MAEIDGIAVSISRKAYDALSAYTNQLNEKITTIKRKHIHH